MPRWKATIRGKLEFERIITVYACNQDDAAIIAAELTEKSVKDSDSITIENINIVSDIQDTDTQFEIYVKEVTP